MVNVEIHTGTTSVSALSIILLPRMLRLC